MNRKNFILILFTVWNFCTVATFAVAQNTAFTYQGGLNNNGAPANGSFDIVLGLYPTNTGGSAIAGPVTNSAVVVTNGTFTTMIDFGSNVWNGQTNWLQLGVGPAGSGNYTTLLPRQQIPAVPYAIYSLTAGSVIGSVSLSALPGFQSPGYNTISGGRGNTNFNGAEYDTVAGGYANSINSGIYSTLSGGYQNQVNASSATVGGGSYNNSSGQNSTVSGGYNGAASGYYSTVSGGADNSANGSGTFVGGGGYDGSTYSGNGADANASAVVGGLNNHVYSDGSYGFLGGGQNNAVGAYGAAMAGGIGNYIAAYGQYSFIGAGQNNLTSQNWSVVAGGVNNTASGQNSAVAGGYTNVASATGSFIGAGQQNVASGNNSIVVGGALNSSVQDYNTVGGGLNNTAGGPFGNEGKYAVITGGQGNSVTGDNSAVGGGYNNSATGGYAAVPGGANNTASGEYSFAAGQEAQAEHNGAFVWADSQNGYFASTGNNQFLVRAGGGVGINTASPKQDLSVNGGIGVDTAGADNGTVSTAWTLLFGGNTGEGIGSVRVNGHSDSYGLDFYTDFDKRMVITQGGNVGIGNSAPGYLLVVGNNASPAYCDGGNWVNASDRDSKQDFAAIDPREVLKKVSAMPITEWRYKADQREIRHLGPVAQDFHSAFSLNGGDDRHISTVDESGVALAAIQGLNQKLETQLKVKDAEIQDLKSRLETLERLILAKSGDSK